MIWVSVVYKGYLGCPKKVKSGHHSSMDLGGAWRLVPSWGLHADHVGKFPKIGS